MAHLSESAPTIASAQSGPWTGGDVPLASRSSRQMAVAARAFLNALGADQLGSVQYPDLGDAARTQWSNLPPASSPRPGASLGDLSDSQRVLLHDLLRASTSSQGYHKMTGAIRAEEVLHDLEGGNAMFGAGYYYATVFGSPEDANWAWMLTGHHMSAMFTVAGDRTAFTPMFTGAQPLQIPSGLHAGWQALPQDAARASELLTALSSDQQSVAIIGTSAPGDVLAGPGRQASLTSFKGIAAGQLDDGAAAAAVAAGAGVRPQRGLRRRRGAARARPAKLGRHALCLAGAAAGCERTLLLPRARPANPDRVRRAGAAEQSGRARPRDHPRPDERLRHGLAGAALSRDRGGARRRTRRPAVAKAWLVDTDSRMTRFVPPVGTFVGVVRGGLFDRDGEDFAV